MAGGRFGRMMVGAAEGLENTALLAMKAAILQERDANMAQYQADADTRRAGLEQTNRMALLEKEAELKGRNQRAISDAVKAANVPTTEQTPEVDYPTTRTPTPRELYAVAERAALEQGDATSAKAYRDLSKPTLTKVGQDESILDETGRVVYQNGAGDRRRERENRQKHTMKLNALAVEYGLKRQLESYKVKHGDSAGTALIRNVDFLVKSGIAKSPEEAFSKLKTSNEKPESDAILGIAAVLMRDPRYRGKGGVARVKEDAMGIVREIRGSEGGQPRASPAQGGLFASDVDVRNALRRGEISRKDAIRELGNFGYSME